MKGTSGPISYDSSPSGDLQRSLESKLRASLDANGSLEYELIWKHWATESGSPICALRASARRTSVNVYIGWPTACTPSGGRSVSTDKMDATGRTPDGKKHTASLEHAVKFAGWATCDANAMNDGETLETFTERQARMKKKHGNGNGMGMPIALQVQLAGWATAKSSDGEKSARTPEGAAKELATRHSIDLPTQAVLLSGWPTTTTRDSKGNDAKNRAGAPSLCEVAYTALGPIFAWFLVPTGRRAVLAPEFSLWLMGYPEAWAKAAPNSDAWRAAQAALELEYLKDLETLLSQSSPPSSSEPS